MDKQYFYRYIDVDTTSTEFPFNSISLRLEILEVIKETNCGYWLTWGYGTKRFVLKYGTKRYAWPTKEQAYTSFLERKKKHLKILKEKVATIEAALKIPPEYAEELGVTYLVKE